MNKEKTYNILLFILIFLILLSSILLRKFGNTDELWHYNFARNIAEGLIPYKDFNIIVTPLLAFICGFILKITSYELIIMRILGALLGALIVYMTYLILRTLNVRKELSIIFIYIIGYLFKDIFCVDYNQTITLIVLIIIYIEIKFYKKDCKFIKYNLKEDVLLGLLGGLAVLTKHTIGMLVCIVLLGNKLLFVTNKEELLTYIKSFLYRLIGIIAPILIFIIYLIKNNALNEFVSYAILGISEFENMIPYTFLLKMSFIRILAIAVPITIIYVWIKTVIFGKEKENYLIMIYGLATFMIAFPISSKGHFLVGTLPIMILIITIIYNFLENKNIKLLTIIYNFLENKNIKLLTIICKILVVVIIIISIRYFIINTYKYLSSNFSTMKHFKYIPIKQEVENAIKTVDEYIIENNAIILDSSAAIYMIPIERYNKDYDMLNKGNLGKNGEENIIQRISNSKNIKYLILKEKYKYNWQMPLTIVKKVKIIKTKIGEIGVFDVYE